MVRRRFEITTFIIGALGGAAAALIYLWPLPFTLRGTVGILVAGAVAGVTLAAGAFLVRRLSGASLYGVALVAGALGGAVWWLVVGPPSTIALAALIGAVVVVLVAWEGSSEPGVR
jgi:hypothetical protein